MKIGQLAVKIAGKDGGKTVVIVDSVDYNFVIIDGDIKRKRCNIAHLEPLNKEIKLKKGAEHTDVVEAFKRIGIEIKNGTKKRENKERTAGGKIHGVSSNKPADTTGKRADK